MKRKKNGGRKKQLPLGKELCDHINSGGHTHTQAEFKLHIQTEFFYFFILAFDGTALIVLLKVSFVCNSVFVCNLKPSK